MGTAFFGMLGKSSGFSDGHTDVKDSAETMRNVEQRNERLRRFREEEEKKKKEERQRAIYYCYDIPESQLKGNREYDSNMITELKEEDAISISEKCNNLIFDVTIYNTDVRSARKFNNMLTSMKRGGIKYKEAYFRHNNDVNKPELELIVDESSTIKFIAIEDRIFNWQRLLMDASVNNDMRYFNYIKSIENQLKKDLFF